MLQANIFSEAKKEQFISLVNLYRYFFCSESKALSLCIFFFSFNQ
jgi:hypothetical protein